MPGLNSIDIKQIVVAYFGTVHQYSHLVARLFTL